MAENKKIVLGGVEVTLMPPVKEKDGQEQQEQQKNGIRNSVNLVFKMTQASWAKIVGSQGLPTEPVLRDSLKIVAACIVQEEWCKAFLGSVPASLQAITKRKVDNYKAELEAAKLTDTLDVVTKRKSPKAGSSGGAVRDAQKYQLTALGVEQLTKKELTAQRFIVARTVQLLGAVPGTKVSVTFKDIAEKQKEYEGIKHVPEKNVQFHCNSFLKEDLFAKVGEDGLTLNKSAPKEPAEKPAAKAPAADSKKKK